MKKFASLACLLMINFYANATNLSQKAVNLLNKPYEYLFGTMNASAEYQEKAHQALSDYGICDVQSVPVKQMNAVASKLIGNELLSFTLFGLWFNEKALNEVDPVIKEWDIYHEAAHYMLNHHAKALAVGSFLSLLVAHQVCYSPIESKIMNIGCTALIGYFSYETLKSYVRIQELQADIETTRILCRIGKKETVATYLELLKSHMLEDCLIDDWHYSLADQYSTINYYYQLYR